MENPDCLAHILSQLPIREREQCRLVSTSWSYSADILSRTQQVLNILGHRDDPPALDRPPSPVSSTDLHWPHRFIWYHCYCLLLNRFPNLRTIRFESICHWNDHLVKELTSKCPALTTIEFVRCNSIGAVCSISEPTYLMALIVDNLFQSGQSRMNESHFYNMTFDGWNRLVQSYGQQVTTLILRDCDLNDRQLEIIVNGFRALRHLDITDNRFRTSQALANLPPTIQTLKLGPKLIENYYVEMPIRSVISGHGRMVSELHLQGFLSDSLLLLNEMSPHLKTLVVHFMRTMFPDDYSTDVFECFAAVRNLQCLERLEIHQHNIQCCTIFTKEQFRNFFTHCTNLERFVFHCDTWYDSCLDDQSIAQLRKNCPTLKHIELCPGSFQTTNQSLKIFASFSGLRYLKLVEFSGINQRGILDLLNHSKSLQYFTMEECCYIDSAKFVRELCHFHQSDPYRRLYIDQSWQSSFMNQKFRIPEHHPLIYLSMNGQKEGDGCKWRKKPRNTNHQLNLNMIFLFILNGMTSVVTFISTLSTFFSFFLFLSISLVQYSIFNLSFVTLTNITVSIALALTYYLFKSLIRSSSGDDATEDDDDEFSSFESLLRELFADGT